MLRMGRSEAGATGTGAEGRTEDLKEPRVGRGVRTPEGGDEEIWALEGGDRTDSATGGLGDGKGAETPGWDSGAGCGGRGR